MAISELKPNLTVVELTAVLARTLFSWHEVRIEGGGDQRRVVGHKDPGPRRDLEVCPKWTRSEAAWQVIDELHTKGFRVNIIECAPGVGEVCVVEHSQKHPLSKLASATFYFGVSEGADTLAVALCRAAVAVMDKD